MTESFLLPTQAISGVGSRRPRSRSSIRPATFWTKRGVLQSGHLFMKKIVTELITRHAYGMIPAMEEMTEAQSKVLAFVARHIRDEGAPPTYRDIAENFGFKSTRAAQDHVAALVRKGKLEHIPGVARGLRIAEDDAEPKAKALAVPILGAVGASQPREAWETNMGATPFPRDLVKGRDAEAELFALRVKGDSMIDAGIFEGDLLIARSTRTASHGDIVIALLDGESTVKRLSKTSGKIHLVPENKRMKPIAVAQGDLQIQGKVIGLQRYWR